jgi:hypothetical protein
MKSLLGVSLAIALLFAGISEICAETAKTYQVTGPVLELTEKTIVVEKGTERWEVARDDKTRVDGELKVGSKVTIHYRMIAVSVESKTGKAEEKKKSK